MRVNLYPESGLGTKNMIGAPEDAQIAVFSSVAIIMRTAAVRSVLCAVNWFCSVIVRLNSYIRNLLWPLSTLLSVSLIDYLKNLWYNTFVSNRVSLP